MRIGNHLVILLTISFLALWYGCTKEEINAWPTDKGLVWFTEIETDFSFKNHPDVAEGEYILIPIPLTTATTVSDKDRVVEVEVSRSPIDSRTKFELQVPVTFHAGHIVDTMYVKVMNSSHFNTVHDTVGFTLQISSDFEPGLKDNRTVNLCLYNGYVKPEWWTENVVRFLGYFSELKMEVLVTVTGSDEMPVEDWYGMDANYLVFKLNDYIKQNDIRYPADAPNKPGEQPLFDFLSY